jgi:hypothetical protein
MRIVGNIYFFILFAGITVGVAGCTRAAQYDNPSSLLPVVETTQTADLTATDAISSTDIRTPLTPSPSAENSKPVSSERYAVAFLADGEILNVRSGPGVTYEIVGSLQANSHNLRTTGEEELVDEVPWMEIYLENGVGWVSGVYLTEEKEASEVCDDPLIGVLLDGLITALRNQDGEALSELVSPIHGLTIQHNVWNPPVRLSYPDDLRTFYTSDQEYDWGIHEASGEALTGSISEVILPRLENVLLQNHTRQCNTLEKGVATGPTTGYVYWPYDYSAFNYIALYRSAPPEQELDWRTWVAGIEYIDGKPYLVVLIQFYWEI